MLVAYWLVPSIWKLFAQLKEIKLKLLSSCWKCVDCWLSFTSINLTSNNNVCIRYLIYINLLQLLVCDFTNLPIKNCNSIVSCEFIFVACLLWLTTKLLFFVFVVNMYSCGTHDADAVLKIQWLMKNSILRGKHPNPQTQFLQIVLVIFSQASSSLPPKGTGRATLLVVLPHNCYWLQIKFS